MPLLSRLIRILIGVALIWTTPPAEAFDAPARARLEMGGDQLQLANAPASG